MCTSLMGKNTAYVINTGDGMSAQAEVNVEAIGDCESVFRNGNILGKSKDVVRVEGIRLSGHLCEYGKEINDTLIDSDNVVLHFRAILVVTLVNEYVTTLGNGNITHGVSVDWEYCMTVYPKYTPMSW